MIFFSLINKKANHKCFTMNNTKKTTILNPTQFYNQIKLLIKHKSIGLSFFQGKINRKDNYTHFFSLKKKNSKKYL